MTKSALIGLVAQQLKLSRKDAATAVDAVFESIAHSLEAGRRVELRGFGSFGLKERSERTGRNPKTGESVPVEAKRVLFFKTGMALRKRVDTLDKPPSTSSQSNAS
ncbi:MAG: integration host factor subunit beta [Magnetococcales bacterium]|nr:integration host factor subunit beta [Magnetococcales bacterium]MBF0116087.1 integration host factor subunit beta [Magnetococcales bacterium]